MATLPKRPIEAKAPQLLGLTRCSIAPVARCDVPVHLPRNDLPETNGDTTTGVEHQI